MPTMGRLSDMGLRYTNWRTTALCSPTRSSLLTGRNAHSNGMACIVEGANGFPGLNAVIPPENVTVDIPTLILAGSLDTSTSAYRSQIVADDLANDTFVVLPGRTHIQLNGANDCAGQIMTQFVLNSTAPLDTSCAEESSPYLFILTDGSQSDQ